MINITNPLDETQPLVFQTVEEWRDWLMKEFNSAVNDLAEATKRKAILVKLLNDECTDTKPTGTVKVAGNVYEASIVRGLTPKYAVLDKEADPILQELYTHVEEAREFIRVSFDERLAGMQGWLDSVDDNMDKFTPEEKEVIKKFIACRMLSPSSPQIKVKQISEVVEEVDTNV